MALAIERFRGLASVESSRVESVECGGATFPPFDFRIHPQKEKQPNREARSFTFDFISLSSFEYYLFIEQRTRPIDSSFNSASYLCSDHVVSFIPLNFCLVSLSLLSGSFGTYAQTERDGYRQVNTLLSQAHMDIIRDGQLHSICTYNAGFAWGEGIDPDEVCSKGVVDPDSCSRKWDNSEEPAGILAKIISTGKFKWCLPEADLCPDNDESCIKNGFVGVAEEDNELQGIAEGDYYGYIIDKFNALTITMGKILHVPLKPKIVVIK